MSASAPEHSRPRPAPGLPGDEGGPRSWMVPGEGGPTGSASATPSVRRSTGTAGHLRRTRDNAPQSPVGCGATTSLVEARQARRRPGTIRERRLSPGRSRTRSDARLGWYLARVGPTGSASATPSVRRSTGTAGHLRRTRDNAPPSPVGCGATTSLVEARQARRRPGTIPERRLSPNSTPASPPGPTITHTLIIAAARRAVLRRISGSEGWM